MPDFASFYNDVSAIMQDGPGSVGSADTGPNHLLPLEGKQMAGSRPNRFVALSHLTLAEVIEEQSIPEPNSGCYLWLGSVLPGREYGRLSYRGRPLLAHRAAWEAHNGPIPAGQVVRHKCDNPGCVNPGHLECGTQLENVRDIDARGRRNPAIGERNAFAKLTADDVRVIRASTEHNSVLAERYGLWGASSVNNIRRRRSWKHI